ncbi:hypothetical protein Bcav_0495 [Beutenbergia cavernae DSM 12333]|uniref:Uncharacterized protein n=1 Tax=Beutenbergia cavernae (strain ATCC BAA-8 / DSM 12333 / CCUG 43141 / JCM 11478 / NBRC 16432 / NCIMB 13614 / HKI 0122) TaxID=471853 RepID=C5BX83_BEUC1|nr:hypothetical protein [Beutenbergia cavernae]ACQ78758.1 hypothetical protein Bcav_0495 [Beutenbergia cavernae DSM 12333]
MSRQSLTDRYVYAALRTVPEEQRAELDPELRELVADRIEAQDADEAGDAERAALLELGDPARLAASYIDRPLQLIGPQHYLQWWRLLKLLWAIVPACVAAAVALGLAISGESVGSIIGQTISVVIQVIVHIGFWTTLVFAVLDRTVKEPLVEWTPDYLPEIPTAGGVSGPSRLSRGDVVGGTVTQLLLVGALLWGTFGSPWPWTSVDPLLQSDLWPIWVLYFAVVGVGQIALLVATFRRGFTWPLAAVKVALNVAFAVPAVWLTASGRLLNPDVVALAGDSATDVDTVLTAIIVITVIVIAAWDSIDGAIKASKQARLARRERVAA